MAQSSVAPLRRVRNNALSPGRYDDDTPLIKMPLWLGISLFFLGLRTMSRQTVLMPIDAVVVVSSSQQEDMTAAPIVVDFAEESAAAVLEHNPLVRRLRALVPALVNKNMNSSSNAPALRKLLAEIKTVLGPYEAAFDAFDAFLYKPRPSARGQRQHKPQSAKVHHRVLSAPDPPLTVINIAVGILGGRNGERAPRRWLSPQGPSVDAPPGVSNLAAHGPEAGPHDN